MLATPGWGWWSQYPLAQWIIVVMQKKKIWGLLFKKTNKKQIANAAKTTLFLFDCWMFVFKINQEKENLFWLSFFSISMVNILYKLNTSTIRNKLNLYPMDCLCTFKIINRLRLSPRKSVSRAYLYSGVHPLTLQEALGIFWETALHSTHIYAFV